MILLLEFSCAGIGIICLCGSCIGVLHHIKMRFVCRSVKDHHLILTDSFFFSKLPVTNSFERDLTLN